MHHPAERGLRVGVVTPRDMAGLLQRALRIREKAASGGAAGEGNEAGHDPVRDETVAGQQQREAEQQGGPGQGSDQVWGTAARDGAIDLASPSPTEEGDCEEGA